MIHYVARVRVGCWAVFAFEFTTVRGVESVIGVGHC